MKRQAGIAFRLFFIEFFSKIFMEEKTGSMQAAVYQTVCGVSRGRDDRDFFLPECLISCPLAGQQHFFRK